MVTDPERIVAAIVDLADQRLQFVDARQPRLGCRARRRLGTELLSDDARRDGAERRIFLRGVAREQPVKFLRLVEPYWNLKKPVFEINTKVMP